MDNAKGFRVYSFNYGVSKESRLSLVFVTTSPFPGRGQRFSDSPSPALHIAAGRGGETTRVEREKDDKRVEFGHAHGIQLKPTRSPMLRSQYAPYAHRNNFRDGAARHGGRTTAREAET
ncbi:hypothetical protein JTE90_015261 [Oedothorax gibbosus]|uniref:Uncharacterized protein n=1 Tax=Oedothorax gibbosus TaxID=931172 RepID=A0AAV6TGP5_9ARAC|nr:hypothetical protein JTE90_015261 [Oedothorax gibbosus]